MLCDFRRISRVHDEARDAMAKRMKPAAWNVERVEDRPELVLHDLVARRRPTVPSDEEKPLRIGFPPSLYRLRTAESASGRVIGAALFLLFVDCTFPYHAERRI